MDFETLAKARYSVRKYDARPVEDEKVEKLLRVCNAAPTACNNQPQRIMVVRQQQGLEKLKQCTKYHFDAPLAIIVCCDTAAAWQRGQDGHSSGDVDCAIVGSHLMLQAVELGLGSCWVMAFDPQAVKQQYNLPENIVPVAIFPLGYPATDAKPSPAHSDRLPLADITVQESF